MRKLIIIGVILVSITLGAFGFLKAYSQDKPFFDMFTIAKEFSLSKDHLLNYKNKIDKTLDKIKTGKSRFEKYFVTITFSKYVSEEELEKLVKEYNIKVLAIEGRSIERGTNLQGTFFITPENGMLYDKKLLGDLLKRNDAEFKGFVAIVANIENKDIQQLRKEQLVFLIDPSADAHFVKNPKHERTNSWDGYAPNVFAELEKYSLINP